MSDDLFDDNDGDGTQDGTEGAADGDNGLSTDSGSNDSADSKRINDLMSNWQKEQARAKKLEAELATLKGQKAGDAGSGGKDKGGAPSADQFIEYSRQLVRQQLFDSDPRLKEYGIDVNAISGATPQEMQAALKVQRDLVDRIETQARNRLLIEHGIMADSAGDLEGSDGPLDFGKMSTKEFNQYLADLEKRGL